MSSELQTFFLAMTPLGELRASIPVALGILGMSPWSAWFWSVLGNMVPPIILLSILDPLSRILTQHSSLVKRGLDWWFGHVRNKFQKHYLKWGMAALVIFVAIPLPMTGAWSGAVAAYLFGIPLRPAFFLIFLGVMLAGALVTVAAMGMFSVL